MDNISLVETDKIEAKIQIILGQTDYNKELAREKLEKFNFDELAVIREYFGIPEKKEQPKIKSLNQEIYKQLRGHLDSAMHDYRERVTKGEVRKII